MVILDRFKHFFENDSSISRILREKVSSIAGMLAGENDEEKQFRLGFVALVCPLLSKNGKIDEHSKTVYRRLLEEYFNVQITESHLSEFSTMDLPDIPTAGKLITSSFPDKAPRTAEFLIALAVATGGDAENVKFVRNAALELGMSEEDFSNHLKTMTETEKRKQRFKSSSRGIIAALVIVAVFILAAKYMQSIIFGTLLAFLLLPMEKFYERKLLERKGIIFVFTLAAGYLFFPLKKLSALLTRKGDNAIKIRQKSSTVKERNIIRQAVVLTCMTAILIAAAAGFGISKLTGHYMKDVQNSIRIWENERLLNNYKGKNNTRFSYALDTLENNFETIPIVQKGVSYLKQFLQKPEIRQQMTQSLLRKSGGLLNFTGEILGGFVSLMCDLLLTVFFALLFLHKFAEFKGLGNKPRSGSEYIVRNFFNGIWLPGADENLIEETCKIINGILFRLRTWLKGYLTLILVDSSFYTTCFFFLGLPFFLPLGIIAGCGIALPYLGPVISCSLTLLVTIASGGASAELLLAIITAYLIYNGIIEQFILYPAVIGDSLGLSTLETIIVVLLGAIFAGIPGMIFALPAASVAKFIIPQIYHGFSTRKSVKKDYPEKI